MWPLENFFTVVYLDLQPCATFAEQNIQRLLTCWEPNKDFTRRKRYWKQPVMSHQKNQWSHWPRKPKFHHATDGEEITMKGIRFVCIIADEVKPYLYPLTCLTLFFELPTLNIPTVWRPVSVTHHSTVLLFNFLLKIALNQSILTYVCTQKNLKKKQPISPQTCTYHVDARFGCDSKAIHCGF